MSMTDNFGIKNSLAVYTPSPWRGTMRPANAVGVRNKLSCTTLTSTLKTMCLKISKHYAVLAIALSTTSTRLKKYVQSKAVESGSMLSVVAGVITVNFGAVRVLLCRILSKKSSKKLDFLIDFCFKNRQSSFNPFRALMTETGFSLSKSMAWILIVLALLAAPVTALVYNQDDILFDQEIIIEDIIDTGVVNDDGTSIRIDYLTNTVVL